MKIYRKVTWGEWLVEQRTMSGLNQKVFANLIGIPLLNLNGIEMGRALPCKWVAQRMADALGADRDEFIKSIIEEFEEQYGGIDE